MIWLASVILLTAVAGLWRISHAASTADRLLGIQMLGTTGIAFLLVLAEWQQDPVWRIVALLLALLAAVITAALVQLLRGQSQ
jgi:multicomponent Na+:H+ antiporter subunit F